MGFATISPVVGLYAVALVGTVVAGPAWVWVLPIAFAGQCLLLAVYSELASEFPISGGPYQWTRRLIGPSYGWLTGWVAICSYCAANTTIAYLGAPWALTLLGIQPTSGRIVLTGLVLIVVCALAGAWGVVILVLLNAVATTLAHPDPANVVAGRDAEPVTTAVISSFGSWATQPFAAVVLTAFLSCGMAAQALTARTIYSMARDGALPASSVLRTVDRRGTPVGGVVVTAAVASLGLLLGLEATA